MSNLESLSSPSAVSPTRGSKRHQIKRSLSEFTSPTRGSRNAPPPSPSQRQQHPHQSYQQQIRQLQPPNTPQRQQNTKDSQTTMTRHSLDMPRRDKTATVTSPTMSRKPSITTMSLGIDSAGETAENYPTVSKDNLRSKETQPFQRQIAPAKSAE